MSSPSQDDVDATQVGSDKDDAPATELSSQRSEPESVVATPAAGEHLPVKCLLCEEEFKADEDDELSPADLLREHMSSAHPSTANFLPPTHEESDEARASRFALEDAEQLKRYQVCEMSLQMRFEYFWNVHDVRNFASDYDGNDSGLGELWTRKFDGFERPAPYEKRSVPHREFLPFTDPEIFVDMLKNPWSRTDEELYAITQNAAHTLRAWHDEYIAIDKLRTKASDTDFKKKETARDTKDPVVFDNKKQAELYGYQYQNRKSLTAKLHEDKTWGYQDPFWRSGRIPPTDQYKKLEVEAQKKGTNNLDGWTPIEKDGKEYIPKRRLARDEIAYLLRRESKKEDDKQQKKNAGKQQATPERVTRYGGVKRPATSRARTAASSPAPTRGRGKRGRAASRASRSAATTRPASRAGPAPAPPARGTSTRSRAASKAAQAAAAASAREPTGEPAPAQALAPAPTLAAAPGAVTAPASTRGRRGRTTAAPTPHTSAQAFPALIPATPQADFWSQVGQSLPGSGSPLKKSILAGPPVAGQPRPGSTRAASTTAWRKFPALQAEPSQVRPSLTDPSLTDSSTAAAHAPAHAPAAAGGAATATATESDAYTDPLQLPENQEKLRKSKHPKRTAAMILHWSDFRANGRTRKPKRTKAQIEADKATETETADTALSTSSSKKRKQSKSEPGTTVFSVKKQKVDENETASPEADDPDEEEGKDEQLQPGDEYPTS